MEFKRNKIINITAYIISIILYILVDILLIKSLVILHYYFLFITIPLLLLFSILCLTNIIKLMLIVISMVFGRNDNEEINVFVDNQIGNVNRLCKYSLIGIFASLLSSITILDIIFCLNKEQYNLVAISIVVWILLYYILLKKIVMMIRREIRL